MSEIVDMITKACPDGVKFLKLGEVVANLDSQRRPVTRSARQGGDYPYYGANGVQDFVDDYLFDGTFLLLGEDGSVVNRDGSPILNWAVGKIWVNNHAHVLTARDERIDLRFVFFYLQTVDISGFVTGGAQPKLNQGNMNRIPVPVPPVEVQREIVRVLDHFTELDAELEAELEARRSQYSFYRHQLLSVSDAEDVRHVSLGDICTRVSSGATPLAGRADYYEDGVIPWLRTQEVVWRDIWDTDVRITEKAVKKTAVKWIPENCVIVAISGASAGRAAVNKIPLTTNQHCCNLEIDPAQASYRYVFHWVTAHYYELKALGQGARSDLNASLIKAFPITLPSLQEQERIAVILDQFDALVNGASDGIPAEIDARRKQYEYYRGKLLAFEEVPA